MTPPVGGAPRVIPRDESFVRSAGLRMQLTPDGDCREASFTAKGAGLRVPPLSAVQIEYLSPSGWTPLYYGEVRQGGNARDVNGETYILRSLAQRLKEVTLSPGFSTPKQAAHLTVRAVIQDVLPQLAGLVLYDDDLCPDLGYDCREMVRGNEQTAWALLEQIAEDGAGMGVTVAWGVRPDAYFFCKPARADTATLSESETIALTWKAPVAETPYTAVLWFVAQRSDGSWVTHMSLSPAAATYGRRVKRMSVEGGLNPWEIVAGAYTYEATPDGVTWEAVEPIDPANPEILVDSDDKVQNTVVIPGVFGRLRFTAETEINRVHVNGRAATFHDSAPSALHSAGLALSPLLSGEPRATPDSYGYNLNTAVYPDWDADGYTLGNYTSTSIDIRNADGTVTPRADNRVSLTVTEVRPERLNTELLDNLARYHYSVPASEPADIELRAYRSPGNLTGRVALGDYSQRVDAWEYRLTAGRGLTLAALTGQADDPAKLAQASLIKQRDGQATITALTAQT